MTYLQKLYHRLAHAIDLFVGIHNLLSFHGLKESQYLNNTCAPFHQ